MAGDISRVRFDPFHHFAAVLKQQGRVDLDADWNELNEILQRRWRAETVDVIGRCVVPRETPDGFLIRASGNVDNRRLEIGPGRIYVDGLLAENHGAAPFNFDLGTLRTDGQPVGVLGELVGEQFVRYEDQPYRGAPLTLPSGPGPFLVYLDVWHREVTATQDTGLLEEALGGVDTTTRLQTVWQVRFLLEDIPRSVNCATPDQEIQGWTEQTQATAARLSTFTNEEEQPDDPCLLPPSGGYRGLENQLYRIAIHDPGVAGEGATFKWSRDNASVTTRILEFSGTSRIRVATLGRDGVLGFAVGNWVEVTDDRRELDGRPGHMARIVEINPDLLEIDLSGALPADLRPAGVGDDTASARNSRLIRWDQHGAALDAEGNELVDLDSENSGGVIPVPAEAGRRIRIEHGIEVAFNFDPADGLARSGDYWCFAARTATADIEHLTDAPPRGIHHHYCRLGIVTWRPNGLPTVLDCREHWPPAFVGCCTVTVAPGENIQAALDSLPAAGGCVCLRVGEHRISEPLRIEKSNVTLHGETLGAQVRRSNGATLLQIAHPGGLLLENIVVSGIHFEFENTGAQQAGLLTLVAIDRCQNTKVEGCVVEAQELQNSVGIMIGRSLGIEITDNEIRNITVPIWVVKDTTLVKARCNVLTAITANNEDGGVVGIFLMEAFGPSVIEGNSITGFLVGIAVNTGLFDGTPRSLASGSVIAGNRISRLNGQFEISDAKVFAIDVAANDCTIYDNHMNYGADQYGGIVVSGANACVERNNVRSSAEIVSETPSIGILVARIGPQGSLGSFGGRIVGNRILGAQDGVVLIGNERAEVLDNGIESDGRGGRFAIGLLASSRVRIDGNRITNFDFPVIADGGTANKIVGNTLFRGRRGATLLNQVSLEFTQNRVEDMRNYGLIALLGLEKFAIVENRFLSCGYAEVPSIGIGVSVHVGELHIESNEVMNTGVSPNNALISTLAWGIFADLVLEARVQSNNVTYANAALLDANQEHRALWLRGLLDQTINVGAGQFVFGFSAQILDNKFLGPGRSALVEIAQAVPNNLLVRFERVFFNNNFCWHVSVAAQSAATVSLVGRSAIVMGNHIKTNVPIPSVDFHGLTDAVYMGNMAQTGPANFGGIPLPISGFNKP